MAFVDDTKAYIGTADGARVEDYFALLKPRVMSLVVFTAIIGLLLAPGGINPVIGVIAILCIALGAGGSGALNMWYDSDIDAVMSRTRNRPIPGGRVSRGEALAFGLICSGFSVGILGLATNFVAAGLLAFTIFFYAVVYTMWLKRSTPQNIVIGGAAGAFPPMIGWAAVTGSMSFEPILLFLIIFFWTPPHFWALAIYRMDDFRRAGVPMLPVVKGEATTRLQILLYTLLLVPLGIAPYALGYAGLLYAAVSVVTGLGMLILAVQVYRERLPSDQACRHLFAFSILYLFLLFAVLMVDRGWGGLMARLTA